MNKKAISNMMIAGIIVVVLIVAAVGVYLIVRPPWAQASKVGLILATGGLGDKSFNDISLAGVQKARDDLGIDFDYVEPKAIAEYEGFQRDFAKSGKYSIIICIGFDQADALNKTAADYPNQKFAIVDMVVNQPNVASLLFKTNEGSFLVGVVAGMKTHTGKVGFVGGMDIPLIRDFFKGYQAGVQWANSSANILPPVFVGGWADPTKGKELALGLADLGADAVFVAAGKSGLGALDGIDEREIMGLGVDACQCYLHPDSIKASMTKRVDVAVFDMINATKTNTFQGGIYNKGLKDEWVGVCRLPSEQAFWEAKFEFTHRALETAVTNKMIEANNEIIAGHIDVPTAY
jgi:basic membrane protein A